MTPARAAQAQGTLDGSLRGRRAAAAGARGAAARTAVQYRYRPPPMAAGAGAPGAGGRAAQTALTDFFMRRLERASEPEDMEA